MLLRLIAQSSGVSLLCKQHIASNTLTVFFEYYIFIVYYELLLLQVRNAVA